MQLVITYKEHVSTTSLLVAQKFGKNHRDVLRAISMMECSPEFRERNFALSSYRSAQNRVLPMYIIGRDGFTMLVMSFTGPKAATFREEFIDEFNRMEEVLRLGKTPVLLPTYSNRLLSEPTTKCPSTHWSIFDQSHSIMFFVEKYIGSVSEYDLVDGSIGIHWSRYRQYKPWKGESASYPHEYNDQRGDRECKCYPWSELQYFQDWLKEYKSKHLLDYLSSKYTREKNKVMLDKVLDLLPRLIKAS